MAEPPTAPTAGELTSRLQAAATGTPYTVVPAADGFAVQLDLRDERWWSLLERYGVGHAFRIDAAVDEQTGTVATTVRRFGLTWQPGGPPGRSIPVAEREGTVLEREFGDHGRVIEFDGAAPDAIHSFSAIEAAGWLWRQVAEAGLRPRTSTGQKAEVLIAAVIAVIAVVGALAAVIALLVTRA